MRVRFSSVRAAVQHLRQIDELFTFLRCQPLQAVLAQERHVFLFISWGPYEDQLAYQLRIVCSDKAAQPRSPRMPDQHNRWDCQRFHCCSQFIDLAVQGGRTLHRLQDAPRVSEPLSDWPHLASSTRPAVYDNDFEGLNPMRPRQDWCRSAFVNHQLPAWPRGPLKR